MNWNYDNNELVQIEDGRTMRRWSILDYRDLGRIRIVIVRVPKGMTLHRNVFGIRTDGAVAWQIESVPDAEKDPYSRYVNFVETLNDKSVPPSLRIGNWNCSEVEIDPETGKVLRWEWVHG